MPERENGPGITRAASEVTPPRGTDPSVAQLVDHLEQVQRRVCQEAMSTARASYWLRRAAAFRAALPRQTDWHGSEGLASVRARRDRLKAIVVACEHAAEVALWQDGETDGL